MMRKALDSINVGIKIGGEFVQAKGFADDQAFNARAEKEFQRIMNEKKRIVKINGIKVSIKKKIVLGNSLLLKELQ